MERNAKPESVSIPLQILLSAFLLILCFPKYNFGWLAWIALVPALSAVQKSKSYKEAFLIFYVSGFLFYSVSMEWIRHVTYFGWFVVVAFLAVYFGIFGIAARFFIAAHRFGRSLIALPALWTVLEWIRTEIPDWSLGWNLLAYSQSDYLAVARLASFIGAFGVSFLIVFANLAVFLNLSFLKERLTYKEMSRAILTVGILVLCLLGLRYLPAASGENFQKSITPSVIQGNIPHNQTWDEAFRKNIIEQYTELTKLAAVEKPDLIIWPEAAWPGILNEDPERDQVFNLARSLKTPILAGSPFLEAAEANGIPGRIFNSAYFINQKGEVEMRYDKIRLVPFGEFIPWAPVFRFLGLENYAYSFGVGDFSHGSEYTIFETNGVKYAPLICYEDIFPSLAREFVKRGAEFLVVMTNDSWYSKSAATYQHLQGSIFRAIENGVPVVRAANIGVSGFISKDGEVLAKVTDKAGNDSWIAGGLAMQLRLGYQPTFYTQTGYLFPLLCGFAVVFAFFASRRRII